MRVLQLIDSLEAGGAERMSVNLANTLLTEVEASFLCATRSEGLLKESLKTEVGYLFLKRKRTLDFWALKRLLQFVKQEHITVVHAHASSYFMATLLKLVHPKIIIIWHDHYGNSEFLDQRPKTILKWCSKVFKAIITVNAVLEDWDKQNLYCKQIMFLPNFVVPYATTKTITKLKGVAGKRVLCLANLRAQKDHITLLNGFQEVLQQFPEWTLHCVGKDFKDAYAETIKTTVKALNLGENVFFYGSCKDTTAIIAQADIGVLASKSEGLPLVLLEYGQGGLPVVATNVGDCNLVISSKQYGELIPSENPEELAKALIMYMTNTELRQQTGDRLRNFVTETFSEAASIKQILALYV